MTDQPVISLTIYGHPEPAGSKIARINRSTGKPFVTDANKYAGKWKETVRRQAREQFHGPVLNCAIAMSVKFYVHRPKTVTRPYPSTKPDIDKLSRAILDGLTGAVYQDDSRVVKKLAEKHYIDPEAQERVEIRLRGIE